MLNQLLKAFFSKKDPDQTIKDRLSGHWSGWLQPISPEKPTGDDPTYSDNFQEMKEEIGKLSGVDYALIIGQSESLLKFGSKDIRVATYYCWARLQADGAEGFADGLELLAGLLDRFGKALYPSRNNIRKNAIEWLANAKFTDRLKQLQPIPAETLERIIAALNLIDVANKAMFDEHEQQENLPNLDGLISFFASSLKQPVKVHSTNENPASPMNVAPVTESTVAATSAEIHSQRDLLEQARRMATFLRKEPKGYLAAGRLLRSLRWDTILDLPPDDGRGKTRLAAPRAELKQHIGRLALQQQWLELFERVEAAYMEGANHFWLDLQRYAIQALQKLGSPYREWADIYLTDIGLMLERLSGIERLSFENGTPFADDETLSWIAQSATIHRLDGGASFEAIAVSGDNDWQEIEVQALEMAQNDGLEASFNWLQQLPSLTQPKARYLLQYVQSRIAEQMGQQAIAIRLLQGLVEQQNLPILQWEPTLMFDVQAQLIKLLKQQVTLKDNHNKPQLHEQIDRLTQMLIQLDPARALTVI